MKLVTNSKLIKRNKMIGNIASIVGIVVLGVGLVLNFNPTPTKTIISFAALIVGFIISQISTYFVTRFSRSPRFDEIIADNLTKLDNDYTLFVYTSPVPILLISEAGIWIPVPVMASGQIYYDKKWRQRGGGFMMKLFGQENIGKPEMDIKANEKAVRKALEGQFDELPPINSILVSMHPKAEIGDTENAPHPIVEVNALRRNIRKVDRKVEEEDKISPEKTEQIIELWSSKA